MLLAGTNTNPKSRAEEELVEKFLTGLGLKKIECECDNIIMDGKMQIGEIDLLFEHKDCLLIVEVSTKKALDNPKKNYFFSKWSDGHNLRKLRKQCKLGTKPTYRVYFDRVTATPENHAGLDHITARRKGNKVVYKDRYAEFEKYLERGKPYARRRFLKYVRN